MKQVNKQVIANRVSERTDLLVSMGFDESEIDIIIPKVKWVALEKIDMDMCSQIMESSIIITNTASALVDDSKVEASKCMYEMKQGVNKGKLCCDVSKYCKNASHKKSNDTIISDIINDDIETESSEKKTVFLCKDNTVDFENYPSFFTLYKNTFNSRYELDSFTESCIGENMTGLYHIIKRVWPDELPFNVNGKKVTYTKWDGTKGADYYFLGAKLVSYLKGVLLCFIVPIQDQICNINEEHANEDYDAGEMYDKDYMSIRTADTLLHSFILDPAKPYTQVKLNKWISHFLIMFEN